MTLTQAAQAAKPLPGLPDHPAEAPAQLPECTAALRRHHGKNHDFGPIIRLLLREQKAGNEAEAQDLIQALSNGTPPAGHQDQVLRHVRRSSRPGLPPDDLNSPWYMAFCHSTTGVYTHHEPIGESPLTDAEVLEAAMFTPRLLNYTWAKSCIRSSKP